MFDDYDKIFWQARLGVLPRDYVEWGLMDVTGVTVAHILFLLILVLAHIFLHFFEFNFVRFPETDQITRRSLGDQSSDKRLKENVEYIPYGVINKASKTKLKQFNFKGSNELNYGVIADELEVSNPELVHVDKNGYKSVDYIGFLLLRIAKLEIDLKNMKS